MTNENIHDVVNFGGGPAGLSAALLLGKGLRKVEMINGRLAEIDFDSAPGGVPATDSFSPAESTMISPTQLNGYGIAPTAARGRRAATERISSPPTSPWRPSIATHR